MEGSKISTSSVHLISVESPRAELHLTLLLVEREVGDVDGARALVDCHRPVGAAPWRVSLVDCRRDPQHQPSVEDDHVRLVRDFVVAVRAGTVPHRTGTRDDNGSAGHGSSGSTNLSGSLVAR